MTTQNLTIDQKLDAMEKRIKRIEAMEAVKVGITILVFVGIVNFTMLKEKIIK